MFRDMQSHLSIPRLAFPPSIGEDWSPRSRDDLHLQATLYEQRIAPQRIPFIK